MQKEDVLGRLKAMSDPQAVREMARYGITPETNLGVPTPSLRSLAGEIGVDHGLAQELWASGVRDARLVACLIEDPAMVTESQMDDWARGFDSWDVCDACCAWLFRRTAHARARALEWSGADAEFVKRAGFVLMANFVVSEKKAADEWFEVFFPIIVREAGDDRNYVKRAVNWALRQIGKRNLNLNQKAVETAREIQRLDAKSARWIASDALRELTSEKVQKRLQGRK